MVERTAMPKASPRLANDDVHQAERRHKPRGARKRPAVHQRHHPRQAPPPATSALRNAATTLPATTDAAGRGESTSNFAVAFSHSLVIESCPEQKPRKHRAEHERAHGEALVPGDVLLVARPLDHLDGAGVPVRIDVVHERPGQAVGVVLGHVRVHVVDEVNDRTRRSLLAYSGLVYDDVAVGAAPVGRAFGGRGPPARGRASRRAPGARRPPEETPIRTPRAASRRVW